MKRLGIIAMAFTLLLGMSQCKKEKTDTPANEGIKVPITLNVNGNGSRVAVNTENGEVTFENGDLLYVASNGVFVGTLSYDGTNFSGDITEPTEGQKLQFYFLGNVTPAETMTEGSTTGCSVVISDQTEHLPVISYAPSRENYQVGKMDYNATLLNKCALVKFDVTTSSEAATCILGMNNKVTVDFTENSFDYSQEGEGIITLPAGSGEKWAILLPQDEVTEAEVQANDGSYSGTCATIPAIAENDYLTDGIAVTLETPAGPVGIINGVFTINDNRGQVYFSQGNLQYRASSNTWRFAENQWNYVGDGNYGNVYYYEEGEMLQSNNSGISQSYSGWIDLFGWGTSGYDHGAVCYQPWSATQTSSYYNAYGQYDYNLYDQTGQADWGYNAISNGGNTENSGWRTLTQPEWEYVFNNRNTTSGIRYAKAYLSDDVNGVFARGVILLPDNWSSSIYTLNNTNISNSEYYDNIITITDWTNILEANGAVFLPAAGDRRNNYSVYNVSYHGNYWSATFGNQQYVWNLSFFSVGTGSSSSGLTTYSTTSRCRGLSVRLVRFVE